MISSVDEIPNIIKHNDSKKLTLIHKDNDLIKCCIELIEASGYLPKIKFYSSTVKSLEKSQVKK